MGEGRTRAVDAVLVGAGNRGLFTYGSFARRHPEQLRFVGVADPDPERRDRFGEEHRIPVPQRHADWPALLEASRAVEAVVIATGDTLHVEPALAALAAGHHVLLEKPIAPEPVDCVRVVEAAERAGRILQIGHVLRFASFYREVARILASGALGELVNLDLKEHVAHWHMAHSYVRGKFRRRALAAPILLAKACHDLDLLVWFAGRAVHRVASFGARTHFRPEAAPAGATPRCTDGCAVQTSCPHDAERFYLGPDDALAAVWPWADLGPDPSREARRRALEEGPYGRCVYRCDNDVLDHQVVAVEFEGGPTATFTLQGLAPEERRTLRLTGTRGELRGVLHEGVLEITRPGRLGAERIQVSGSPVGHFGGDDGLVAHFAASVAAARSEAGAGARGAGRVALEGHLLGFAAEEARLRGEVVDLAAFRERLAAPRPV